MNTERDDAHEDDEENARETTRSHVLTVAAIQPLMSQAVPFAFADRHCRDRSVSDVE